MVNADAGKRDQSDEVCCVGKGKGGSASARLMGSHQGQTRLRMPPFAIHTPFYTWTENWHNAAVAVSTWCDAFVLFVLTRPLPDPLMPLGTGRSPQLIENR